MGAAILTAPLAAVAQQAGKVYRIGFLRRAAPQRTEFEAFPRGLRELGYIEGQNVIIEQRYASGDYTRLPALASELVRPNVDALVVDGAATAKAIKSGLTIPQSVLIRADQVIE